MRLPWRSRSRRDADLEDEIQAHLRMAAADRIARGDTTTDAAHAARRDFGNVAHIKELTREVWSGGWAANATRNVQWIDRIRQDVGYAFRGLRRSPGFTTTIVLTLALGVGANGAIFSFLDRVFLKPPDGVRAPSEIRRLYSRSDNPRSPTGFSVVPFFQYQRFAAIRDAMGGDADVVAYTGPTSSSIARGDVAVPLKVSYVSPNYFRALGISISRGRYFSSDEERIEVPAPLAVISHAFWSRAFGLDSSIIGRDVQIGSRHVSIIGVTEPGFTGVDIDATDAFVALSSFVPQTQSVMPWYQSSGFFLSVLVRTPASTDERDILARAALAYNRQPEGQGFSIDTASTMLAGPMSRARGPQTQGQEVAISTRVAGVSLVVLLIACANITNLLLVRATRRRREIAVRLAIGVSRGRLFGQLLTESACLALLGGIGAVAVAWWGGEFLREMLLPNVRWAAGVIDWRVIAVTGSIALCAGLAGGLVPAMQARRQNVIDALKSGSREGTYQRSRLRAALLIVQAALSIVLIAGAGLFVRSLGNVSEIDIGYDVDSLAFVSPGSAKTLQEQDAHDYAIAQLANRLALEPGVISTAPASAEPMRAWQGAILSLPGRDSVPRSSKSKPEPHYYTVSPRFFSTAGIRVLIGRAFTDNEPASSVIVDDRLARAYWPDANPIGQCIIFNSRQKGACLNVVGVVENVHRERIVEESSMQFYLPGGPMPVLVLRIDPARWAAISARARAELATLLPGSASVTTIRMNDRFTTELRPWRMGATLFTAFGALALLVAAVGVYSVISYGVSQRVQEMGVRVALGARARDVIALVVGEGMRVIAIGTAVGVGIAIALGRFVASMLYGVAARDPSVLVASAITLLLVAIVAALLPAWRASRVDPVTALRAE